MPIWFPGAEQLVIQMSDLKDTERTITSKYIFLTILIVSKNDYYFFGVRNEEYLVKIKILSRMT